MINCQYLIVALRVPLTVDISVQRLNVNVVLAKVSSSTISTNVNSILMLSGTNFKDWKENVLTIISCMDLDLVLQTERPPDLENWGYSNRMSLMIMKHAVPETFRGTMSDDDNAKLFPAELEKHFVKSEKAKTSILLAKFVSMRYKGKKNIREYVMGISRIASKLKELKLELSEDLLVHLKDKCSLNELISHCKQEEERLKQDQLENAHLATSSKQVQKKQDLESPCFFCKKARHKKKDCPKYAAWHKQSAN
ncbi:hypothetical protein CDL12_16094 [Handroanthus impetiginosus]|uniref:CCHC-type domain-containing protein n=1 Tax=Handroanthus impetiginosus TaxID=429701 RepID=A0A2G9H1C8_9LAMI|nr:hypothetical protein CDL12_16094 [Handroanthus impetiginosus]